MPDSFVDTIAPLPKASMPDWAMHSVDALLSAGHALSEAHHNLLGAMAGHSDFLARLIAQQPDSFMALCERGPEPYFTALLNDLPTHYDAKDELMKQLRITRQRVALAIAMADVTGTWPEERVTQSLSLFADKAIRITMRSLLLQAHYKQTIMLSNPDDPFDGSGLLVLAMGKLGAEELNYSSDIDVIMLFEPERLSYSGRQSLQHFFTQMAQEFCDVLQTRTREGYVFRTDLRLRPDPRSTPLAVNLNSAVAYYETVGQNWERAAMIKARPVIADAQAAERYTRAMDAFIWRRHLDFAAIDDINSIKRQIDAKAGTSMQIPGHDVKLGRGGIREIEFFAQTQQLIWGGRDPQLRQRPTVKALEALANADYIAPETAQTLTDAYWYLRRVEHYIQMFDDRQTHRVPESETDRTRLASFLGEESLEVFESKLQHTLSQVHEIYADSMQSSPPLSLDGNLVFTGVEADPGTLETLSRLGFTEPLWVSDQIQLWHKGHRRATRSLKARQIVTELIPALLKAFSESASPDDAFKRFDEFIEKVPVGVQIFSLIQANPDVLQTLALILGSAPALGETLARNPDLLDLLLSRDLALPDKDTLHSELGARLHRSEDYELALRVLREFKLEYHFLAGVQTLMQNLSTEDGIRFLSDLADVITHHTYRLTRHHYERNADGKPNDFAIIGLGKLGAHELTFDSDLDLIFVYDSEHDAYVQRFASRLMNAFTLRSKEGTLYELDMRLRPGGSSGMLATSLERFQDYLSHDGWDVEALALTRARIITASDETFSHKVAQSCLALLVTPFDASKLASAIHTLRSKIHEQHATSDPWNVKFVPGGMMDIHFIAQYLRLIHANDFSQLLAASSPDILLASAEKSFITMEDASVLRQHHDLMRRIQHILRLCSQKQRIEEDTSISLRKLVATLAGYAECDSLKDDLIAAQATVKNHFNQILTV